MSLFRYALISIIGGFLFGAMDAIINANPFARKLFEVYKPIAKTSVNAAAGVAVDLFYGFVMAGFFLLLYKSLPGEAGLLKGLSFGVMAWFFRVVMSAASSWMMFNIPTNALIYSLGTGFVEMLVLGTLFGLTLKP